MTEWYLPVYHPRGHSYVEGRKSSKWMKLTVITWKDFSKMTREQQITEELAVRQSLRRLEERREKSILTQTRNRNRHYDKQRAALLKDVHVALLEQLNVDDEAQQKYLNRLQTADEVNEDDVLIDETEETATEEH